MTQIKARRAKREQLIAAVQVAGPSGAGKTLGALLVAYGMMKEKYPDDWEVQLKVGKKAGETSIYQSPAHIRAIRDREWKYAYYFTPGREGVEHELYNLKDDPLEMTNLANDPGYINKRDEMFERMMEQEKKLESEFAI